MGKTKIPVEIHHPVAVRSSDNKNRGKTLHIFFVTGNPGLIAYYTTFLAALYSETNKTRQVAVYGTSLGGFDVNEEIRNAVKGSNKSSKAKKDPLNLSEQIDHVLASLQRYVTNASTSTGTLGRKLEIVLIGHSVGAFIIFEILSKLRSFRPPSSRLDHPFMTHNGEMNFDVVGGILLFPTIMDLAASPKGQKIGWILRLPHLPVIADTVMRWITAIAPHHLLRTLVKYVTQFPDDAVETTTAFLECEGTVRQALFLANDELNTIMSNKWGEDIWNAGALPHHPLKLFFLFGRSDHWVDDHTRDQIMDQWTRPNSADGIGGQPWMEIDETGIPHSFCIRHSSAVAEKCSKYLQQIA